MSFQSEINLARIRKSAAGLVFPVFFLFIAAAILAFFTSRKLETWQLYALEIVVALIAFFLWLVPVIRHLSFYVDLTSSRLIKRDGLFNGKGREVSFANVRAVEVGRGRTITLTIADADALVLSGIPKAKSLAVEIEYLAGLRK